MKHHLSALVLAACLVGIGVASGWFAARQNVESTDEDADAADPRKDGFTASALANMGVTVGEARLTPFAREAKVQATIVDAPLNQRPIAAYLGGIVTKVHVRPGSIVKPNDPIVTLSRAPIARPSIELTADILRPVSENLHESVSRLRTAASQRAIFMAEIARVRRFAEDGGEDGLPVLPRKTLIDLEYDLTRADQELANIARELERHGLSAEEIEGLRAGAAPPDARRLWRRALEQNGLWGELEDRLAALLPAASRNQAWTVAAIGEMSASGMVTSRLLKAFRDTPHLAEHFIEVATLLLSGTPIDRVELVCNAGMLEPIATVRAPVNGTIDLDVATVDVRVGTQLEVGDRIVLLHDARSMWLRLEPLGFEIPAVLSALERKAAFRSTPLLKNAGPDLEGLTLDRFETLTSLEERGSVAWSIAANEEIRHGNGRSWRLRVGMRYVARVPIGEAEERFVLPSGAVTENDTERLIFLEDGKTFRSQPVRVEYEDDEVVVIANDGSLFPGDRVVMSGAFALGLALQSDPGSKVDPHAGHGH